MISLYEHKYICANVDIIVSILHQNHLNIHNRILNDIFRRIVQIGKTKNGQNTSSATKRCR